MGMASAETHCSISPMFWAMWKRPMSLVGNKKDMIYSNQNVLNSKICPHLEQQCHHPGWIHNDHLGQHFRIVGHCQVDTAFKKPINRAHWVGVLEKWNAAHIEQANSVGTLASFLLLLQNQPQHVFQPCKEGLQILARSDEACHFCRFPGTTFHKDNAIVASIYPITVKPGKLLNWFIRFSNECTLIGQKAHNNGAHRVAHRSQQKLLHLRKMLIFKRCKILLRSRPSAFRFFTYFSTASAHFSMF